MPLHGFYVAHLLSGQILATIDDWYDAAFARASPGSGPDAAMTVKVVGESRCVGNDRREQQQLGRRCHDWPYGGPRMCAAIVNQAQPRAGSGR